MPKLLQHPRCKDFYFSPLSQGSLTLAYVTVSAKYNHRISVHVKKTLKNIRKCSFYKAIDIITYILKGLSVLKIILPTVHLVIIILKKL